MDEEILEEETLEQQLEAARSRIDCLEQENQAAEQARQLEAREQRIAAAVAASDCRDPELLGLVLRQSEEEDFGGAVKRLRREKPYLFADNGGRPRFAQSVQGKELDMEEEIVAQRYKNNPWYRRK
jgi:hypothetical protein